MESSRSVWNMKIHSLKLWDKRQNLTQFKVYHPELQLYSRKLHKVWKKRSSWPIVGLIPKLTMLITARKRGLGQGNSFRSVCQEFCPRGGGADKETALARRPPGKETLSKETPQARRPPKQGDPPGKETPPRQGDPAGNTRTGTVNVRAVRILLECIHQETTFWYRYR